MRKGRWNSHGVGEKLRRRGDRDALFVSQLKQPTLSAQIALPELAVSGTTGHRSQEEGVDLNYFLHTLRGYSNT